MKVTVSLRKDAYDQAVSEGVPKKYLDYIPQGAITDVGLFIQDKNASSYVTLKGPFTQYSDTRYEASNARITFEQISKSKVRIDVEPLNRGSGVIGTYITLPIDAVPAVQIGLEMKSKKSSSRKHSRKSSKKQSRKE